MALNPRYLSHVADQLEDLWIDFETDILCELAKRIKRNDFTVSSTTKWKWIKMQEMGYTNDYINRKLAFYLKKTDKQIQEIFDNAIGTALSSNQDVLKEAYENGLIVSSGYDVRKYGSVISLGARQTFNEIKNWTKSYHADVNKNFQLSLDKAFLNVNSGLMTSAQASKVAIEELAKDGILTSNTKGGRVEHADVIVKRAVRTGVNMTTSKVMNGVLDDLGCDLVETSSHLGARPSHSIWQGKVFSRSGNSKKYPSFKQTGYGTGDGLCGWNCRHMFYPFFEGLSSVSVKRYSMQENERVYNLEQKQRYNERMIRKYKREADVLKVGGLDYTKQKNLARAWSKRNDTLINANSDVLKRNYFNERVGKQRFSLAANNLGDLSKAGSYSKVGKLTKLDYETKLKVLKAYEKQIVDLDVENAIVILKNGDVFKVVGDSYTVNPNIVGDLTDSFITHNHPKNETWYTFSAEDFGLFHYHHLEMLRGIDDVYEYELNRSWIVDELLNGYLDETAFQHNFIAKRAKEAGYGYKRKRKIR